MPNRASVEEQGRRNGVPKRVRTHSLRKADHSPVTAEPCYRRRPLERSALGVHDEKRFATIFSPIDELFDPVERSRAKKHHALLIALANNRSLPSLKVDGGAL